MPSRPFSGPARKACTRCRLQKRKCDGAHPSCSLCSRLGQGEACIYEELGAIPTPPVLATDASRGHSMQAALTPFDIKTTLVASLSHTDPTKIMTIYNETIHPWFGIFSQPTIGGQYPATWAAASVEFALICYSILLLHRTPQQLHGVNALHPTHKSMYLMAKTWITLLEGAECNSIDFVKARLLITLFEVSHGFNIAAYLSIANTVRAADALIAFEQRGVSESSAVQNIWEYRIMWWGIAILDRYIVTQNGKWPPVTRGRPVPPDSPISNSLSLQEPSSTTLSRLFESSILLDNVHTALHQPTSQVSFNIEEVTLIVRTLTSFENVVLQTFPEKSKLFSSCLALSSTALLLAFENGSKATCSGASISAISQANAALDTLIDDIVERVAGLNEGNLVLKELSIPLFVIFLVYKAAVVTTRRLQSDIEPEANLLRLRVLRSALMATMQRWLAGKHLLELLDEEIAPRTLKALRGNITDPSTSL